MLSLSTVATIALCACVAALVLRYAPRRDWFTPARLKFLRNMGGVAVGLAVLVLTLSACLGIGDDSATPTPTPTGAQAASNANDSAANEYAVALAYVTSHLGYKPACVDTKNPDGTTATKCTPTSEMINLLMRISREGDPTHIGYVYLLSVDGKIMFYSPVYGKCSSMNSLPTPPDKVQTDTGGTNNAYWGWGVDTSAAQLDGSYGENEPGIFCFTVPNRVLIESNLPFFMSDSYIHMQTPPALQLNCTNSTGPNGCSS